MKAFCKDLSAVAMRAIKTDQFVRSGSRACLTLMAGRDLSEFAKFLALALPKQSYLAARPARVFSNDHYWRGADTVRLRAESSTHSSLFCKPGLDQRLIWNIAFVGSNLDAFEKRHWQA
jgi:hypothetical protein